MFPWSPSWGEISYRAYDLPTVDLDNELYGYIQEKYGLRSIRNVEQWLNDNQIISDKQWTEERGGIPLQSYPLTIQSFIRVSG